MAADLHIHIFEGLTEEDMKIFFSNTIGSKYFDEESTEKTENLYDQTYDKIAKTSSIWVGEVSWLKAALFEDSENFIPSTVEHIDKVIGEDLPIIDDELITKIISAFDLENKTRYELAKKEEIENFLINNKGKRIFTVSW